MGTSPETANEDGVNTVGKCVCIGRGEGGRGVWEREGVQERGGVWERGEGRGYERGRRRGKRGGDVGVVEGEGVRERGEGVWERWEGMRDRRGEVRERGEGVWERWEGKVLVRSVCELCVAFGSR